MALRGPAPISSISATTCWPSLPPSPATRVFGVTCCAP
jgi:hypothetical protein